MYRIMRISGPSITSDGTNKPAIECENVVVSPVNVLLSIKPHIIQNTIHKIKGEAK